MLTGLAHGLDVIEFLAGAGAPVALGDVATAISMSKPGTHRILNTLCLRGFVRRENGGVYRLGYKLCEIGWAVPDAQLASRAAPVMQWLADTEGDGAILGAIDRGFEVLYLSVIESRQTVRVYIDAGSRLPAHVTATGLACIAWLPPESLAMVIPETLPAWTEKTITEPDVLFRELERIRIRGFAQTLGTFRADVGGVAAPIFAADGSVIAALCVSSPLYRIDADWNKRIPQAVMTAARKISGAEQSTLRPRVAAYA
jgi:DNA-binding IclR family transcriptional regulator